MAARKQWPRLKTALANPRSDRPRTCLDQNDLATHAALLALDQQPIHRKSWATDVVVEHQQARFGTPQTMKKQQRKYGEISGRFARPYGREQAGSLIFGEICRKLFGGASFSRLFGGFDERNIVAIMFRLKCFLPRVCHVLCDCTPLPMVSIVLLEKC